MGWGKKVFGLFKSREFWLEVRLLNNEFRRRCSRWLVDILRYSFFGEGRSGILVDMCFFFNDRTGFCWELLAFMIGTELC